LLRIRLINVFGPTFDGEEDICFQFFDKSYISQGKMMRMKTLMRKSFVCISMTLLSFLFISCRGSGSDGQNSERENKAVEANASANKPASIEATVDESVENKAVDTSKRPIVTFIELGSVDCVPCKMMKPVMEQVEKTYGDKVKVVFHDVWTEEGQPEGRKYGIRAIPTQIFLDADGKELFRHEGYFPFEQLDQVLKHAGVR